MRFCASKIREERACDILLQIPAQGQKNDEKSSSHQPEVVQYRRHSVRRHTHATDPTRAMRRGLPAGSKKVGKVDVYQAVATRRQSILYGHQSFPGEQSRFACWHSFKSLFLRRVLLLLLLLVATGWSEKKREGTKEGKQNSQWAPTQSTDSLAAKSPHDTHTGQRHIHHERKQGIL